MRTSKFIKHQLIGAGFITALVGFYALALFLYEKLNPTYAETHVTLSGYDGDGRRGMFVLWLLLIFVFTIIHILVAIYKHVRRSKRF